MLRVANLTHGIHFVEFQPSISRVVTCDSQQETFEAMYINEISYNLQLQLSFRKKIYYLSAPALLLLVLLCFYDSGTFRKLLYTIKKMFLLTRLILFLIGAFLTESLFKKQIYWAIPIVFYTVQKSATDCFKFRLIFLSFFYDSFIVCN